MKWQHTMARALCDKWVERLGWGFHLDTKGADYDPPLTPDEVKDYDGDMERLFALVSDPYAFGVEALKVLEGRRS